MNHEIKEQKFLFFVVQSVIRANIANMFNMNACLCTGIQRKLVPFQFSLSQVASVGDFTGTNEVTEHTIQAVTHLTHVRNSDWS